MKNAVLINHDPRHVLVTRDRLARLPAPRSLGPYHRPVAHLEVIETLEARCRQTLHAKFTNEQWALRRDGALLTGVVELAHGENQWGTSAIGLRHANDESLSLQFVAGLSVFACTNLVLRGDLIILRKRHTLNLALTEEIDRGLAQYVRHRQLLDGEVNRLCATKVTADQAKALIHDAFLCGVMPFRHLPAVSRGYFEPTHAEFKPRTQWSLHNAFTEQMKSLLLTSRLRATQALGTFFNLGQAA